MDTSSIPSVGMPVTNLVKPWYQSVTVWAAILQVIIGLLTAIILLLQNGLTQESVAALAVALKGIFDLNQRFLTTQPIK